MELWYSGAVVDAVREAKSRRALFIVYVRDDNEQSEIVDKLWSDVWAVINDTSNMIVLRLNKGSEGCNQFTAIYKVQTYPTIYFINGQNGQILKVVEQIGEDSSKLHELIEESLKIIAPKQEAPQQATKTVEEKVAEARARLKEIHDKRDEEAKAKEKEDEMNRRRLGQQIQLDKQKKEEELLRKHAEEIRRDRLEQQKLQEKIKAQIQQDREEKRRKFEQEHSSPPEQAKAKVTTADIETSKINYTRSRLQFRLTDGSFFTEDFPCDAHMKDVYAYLNETLPADQYRVGSYILRTTHTRVTLTIDNPNTLKELELVPTAVLLVISRGNVHSPSSAVSSTNVFQSIPLVFTWFMMQFNFVYQFIFAKLFGNRPQQPEQTRSTSRVTNDRKVNKPENFKTDSTSKSTIRRFHNTQDDSDDEEKRTWNGNSTQQL
ncbi:unnamed protein product [Adineta ricciae]|uniref:UBX domain-containing protein 4 n=1 Tax=Adineta ricciae TaxID=249248 RepID=A0A814YHF2_ADIRI|nr:unnamed protein product [Adineta ricciae]